MTTQSEQDELRREVARIFKYYTVAASGGLNATRAKTVIDAEKSLNECTEAVAHLLHQREQAPTKSLLAEVEERVLSFKSHSEDCDINIYPDDESAHCHCDAEAENDVVQDLRVSLNAIRQERLGTKEENLKDE